MTSQNTNFSCRACAVLLLAATSLMTFLGCESSPSYDTSKTKHVLPADHELGLRRALISKRDRALKSERLEVAAQLNAELSSEAIQRARGVYDAWMALRNPETLLFPMSPQKPVWNYHNVAADFFCFQLHTGIYTAAPNVSKLYETLRRESELSSYAGLPLPRGVESGRIDLLGSTVPFIGNRGPLFAASEYVKDGLLSLYEGTGDGEAYQRIINLINAIILNAETDSSFGPIPSKESEVNGEILQTLSRVARVETDKNYRELLAGITEAHTKLMLPSNHGLPCRSYNFPAAECEEPLVPLRDHGNEVIPGLAEAFAFAVDSSEQKRWRERAESWAEPLAVMFETILKVGVREDGLMANSIDAAKQLLLDSGPNDNWGYIASGALLFVDRASAAKLVDEQRARSIRQSVIELSRAVARTDRVLWEGVHHDGYADSVESAMLIAAADAEAAGVLTPWIDDQIGVMFAMQSLNGFVSHSYLDGNFMRTALMFADKRSGGWMLRPWDEQVKVGFVASKGRAALHISGVPLKRYTLFQRANQRGFKAVFPRATPRLNSWPDWSEQSSAESFSLPAKDSSNEPGLQITIPASGIIRFESTMPSA